MVGFLPPHLYNKEVRGEVLLYRHLLFLLNTIKCLRVILVHILVTVTSSNCEGVEFFLESSIGVFIPCSSQPVVSFY